MSFFGDYIIYYKKCSSTNTLALQLLAKQMLPEETVIITDHQYQGRGQRGATWLSEPYKNLTFSLILYPRLPLEKKFMLSIMASLAIYQVISAYIPQQLTIKWPNDIYYQNKKLSGLLIENIVNHRTIKASVIGIGLNVNQEHFTLPTATSLALSCGHKLDRALLLKQLLEKIKSNYIQLKKQEINQWKQAYLKKLYGINQELTFQTDKNIFQGIIRDVDSLGRLVIEQNTEHRHVYDFKEVRLVISK